MAVSGFATAAAGATLAVEGAANLGKDLGNLRCSDSGSSGGGSSGGSGPRFDPSDPGAQNPDVIWKTDDYDGWQHLLDRHRIGGKKYDPEKKGAFIGKGKKVQQWIQQVVKNNPAKANDEGRDGYVYEGRVNAGPDGVGILSKLQSRGLGTNRAYGIRVVLNPDGSLRTAHPIP